ncbi:hypothetical protein [Mameliella alba]|uniref:hypothetical protein n=1 Tax=Mameliella alba TaxID=561184 RepID=UPI000B535324|nr:hypothetical protein CDZ96_18810 [Mameliella alba]GGF75171.1 hypothetical protein GCM10011319_39490 [Mameliella alba]
MAGEREKPEEIVSKLRQADVLQGQGMTVAEAVRQIGVTPQAAYCLRDHGAGGVRIGSQQAGSDRWCRERLFIQPVAERRADLSRIARTILF